MTRVVAIAGSRRDGSATRRGLAVACDGVADAGGTAELIDLRAYDLPPLKPDEPTPGDAEALSAAVERADAVLLGTPTYHGSYSGVLKNALDYLGFEEFEDVTVGLLSVAGGPFPVQALEHLRSVCRALNAWVLPHQVAIPAAGSAFDDDAPEPRLADEGLQQRTETLGRRAVEYAGVGETPTTFTGDHNEGA